MRFLVLNRFRNYYLVCVCLSLIYNFFYDGFVCFCLSMWVCLPVYKCMRLRQWPVYLCLFFCIICLLVSMFKWMCVFVFCCCLYVPLSVLECVLIIEYVLFCCCLCVPLCVLVSVLINVCVCVCVYVKGILCSCTRSFCLVLCEGQCMYARVGGVSSRCVFVCLWLLVFP
jgi:hypothetical protein